MCYFCNHLASVGDNDVDKKRIHSVTMNLPILPSRSSVHVLYHKVLYILGCRNRVIVLGTRC